MTVSYVGVTSGNSAAATSTAFVTSLPAGWQAGDVAILTGHVRGTSLTMATPAGWTLLPGPTWPVNQGTNSRVYAWYRVLQAGDTAPTISNSGSVTGGWSMTVYRGADTSNPIGQTGTAVASGTTVTAPTLTGVLNASALAVAAHAGVSTGTIPTNITLDGPSYTEVADHATSRPTTSANQRMAAGYRLVGSPGTYGGETFTTDIASSMVAVLVEVVAAPTATTVSTSAATGWSTAAVVNGTPRASSWSVAAAVTVNAATRWDTAATVVDSSATGWDIAAQVGASTGTGWASAAETGTAVATGWDTLAGVAADTPTRWRVAAEAAAVTGARWDVAASVEAGWTTSWSVDAAALPPAGRGTLRTPPGSGLRAPVTSQLRQPGRSEVRLR